MRLIVFFICLNIATAAQAQWEKLMTYDQTEFYVDLKSVKSGWITSSYLLLENYSSGESSVQKIQVKCKSLKHKTEKAVYYSRLFGKGKIIDELNEDWTQPVKGSVADLIDRAICGYIKSKK
jgi:hypothetical protein